MYVIICFSEIKLLHAIVNGNILVFITIYNSKRI